MGHLRAQSSTFLRKVGVPSTSSSSSSSTSTPRIYMNSIPCKLKEIVKKGTSLSPIFMIVILLGSISLNRGCREGEHYSHQIDCRHDPTTLTEPTLWRIDKIHKLYREREMYECRTSTRSRQSRIDRDFIYVALL